MALEVRDLRMLTAVAEQGTLTRAGNVLFLTQSALSRQLADLEKRLGVALFQRSGCRMKPTPAGERLVESGREFCAVVAPDHPWAGKPFVVAEDFTDQHVFLYNLARAESTLLSDVLDPAGVTPKRVSRVELTEAILELVRAGRGVATLARWAVAPYLRSGALVTVSITRKGLHRQ